MLYIILYYCTIAVNEKKNYQFNIDKKKLISNLDNLVSSCDFLWYTCSIL